MVEETFEIYLQPNKILNPSTFSHRHKSVHTHKYYSLQWHTIKSLLAQQQISACTLSCWWTAEGHPHTSVCVHFFSLAFSLTVIVLKRGGVGLLPECHTPDFITFPFQHLTDHCRHRWISLRVRCEVVMVMCTVGKKCCKESSSSTMCLCINIWAYMCICTSYEWFIYCTLLLRSNYVAVYVHSRDLNARSALNVQMFHLVVLHAVTDCLDMLPYGHMFRDSLIIPVSEGQWNETGVLPRSTL